MLTKSSEMDEDDHSKEDVHASAVVPPEEAETATRSPEKEKDSVLDRRQRSVASDLSGLAQLSTDAVHFTTGLVEAQHSRFEWISTNLFPDRGPDKTHNPIAALVYNSIHGVTSLVGGVVRLGLSIVDPVLGELDGDPRREAVVAVLNGVLGDHLAETNNPLAIPMQWKSVSNETITSISQPVSATRRHYLVVIHGSCNSPHDWFQQGHNHGIELAKALDWTPLFLNYNSGLHISENGKLLHKILEELIQDDNDGGDGNNSIRISILAHSMGGLVARSACHYAENAAWIEGLDHLVTLGSPHHGAILERGGKLVDAVLGAHRFTEPLSWVGKLRSAGVTDLGYGNVRDEDWNESSGIGDDRRPTPLPSHAQCLAIAAVLGDENGSAQQLGIRTDGLVAESSAFGLGHANDDLNLQFDERITLYNMGHVGLLSSKDVSNSILQFLSG